MDWRKRGLRWFLVWTGLIVVLVVVSFWYVMSDSRTQREQRARLKMLGSGLGALYGIGGAACWGLAYVRRPRA